MKLDEINQSFKLVVKTNFCYFYLNLKYYIWLKASEGKII